MPTFALKLSYDGKPFCGFARQPGMLTVQGELEHALEMLYRRPVQTVCAGRTDSGVHALGQVVSFDLTEDEAGIRRDDALMRSLNALTHDRMSVCEVLHPQEGFSARFDAKAREYRYFIANTSYPPLVMGDFSWQITSPLDIGAMREGASYLIGEHDFKSFCMAVSAVGKPTCRNVISIDIDPVEVMGQQLICIKVVGSSFLHSMVRTIVGTLVAVGRGKRKPECVGEVLEARRREAAGENAPAQGLIFWEVRY